MEGDREAKKRAKASSRASAPGVQFVGAEEANRLDERIAEKTGTRKKRHSSEGKSRRHRNSDSEGDTDGGGSSKRKSSRKSRTVYESSMQRDGAPAAVMGSVSQPGAHAQLNDLEDRISAKTRAADGRAAPGAHSQLNDLEDRITAKSRAGGSKASTVSTVSTAASSQLSDLEDKIAQKTRRESGHPTRRSSAARPGATAQLNELEDKIAQKTRRESRGRRSSSDASPVAAGQLEDLEDRIAAKTRRSDGGRGDRVRAKEESFGTAGSEMKNDLLNDYMDSFASLSGQEQALKHGDDKDDVAEPYTTTTTDHGIAGPLDTQYGAYGGGFDEGLAVAVAVEDEEDDAFIPAAIEYDPDAKPPIYKNRRFRLYSVLSCVVITVVAIAVSVAVTSNKPNNDPTPAPTSYRETLGIQEQLVAVVGEEQLSTVGSPQEIAADWIMNVDPMQLPPDSPNLIQRYLLAVFYYASIELGPWLSCNPPEEGENSTCIYQELTQIEPALVYGQKEWVRWLSDEHECVWAGVFCDENDYIAAIELPGQEMTGTLPDELSELVYLQSITLDWNGFYGTLPASWAKNKHLLNIEVHYNFITGGIPEEWYGSQGLQRMNVGGNMLTGTVSTEVGQLDALKGFFVMENQMTGKIPEEFGSLRFCSYTRWSRNYFSGTIPTVFGNISKLQELWIHRNQLTGTIPTELAKMSDILDLRLHFNPLTGTIPEEIYDMDTLTRLDLYDCQITGTISTSIAKLSNLETFRIRANRGLTGTIPSEIGLLRSINKLWFHITGLKGTMPDEVCAIRGKGDLEILEANCADTDGFEPPMLDCKGCCTECCDAESEVCAIVGAS